MGSKEKAQKVGASRRKGNGWNRKKSRPEKNSYNKIIRAQLFWKARSHKQDKRKRINLKDIEFNLTKYGKKTGEKWHVDLPNYKILDSDEDYLVKNKLVIKAESASKSAEEKVRKAGGEIVVSKKANSEKESES